MDRGGEKAMAPARADWLTGGGEMGKLIREMDWSRTPLGPVEQWPQSLRTAVSICLNSKFPMVIWWGPELRLIYNDRWRPILGENKHRRALGSPGREIWPEIWDVIGPMFESVMNTGEATWSDDGLLLVNRYGYIEEAYFTWSYSPIRDESGGIGGVFTAVSETTGRVVGERRLKTLRDLGEHSLEEAKTAEQACHTAATTLAENLYDFPFALIYLLDQDSRQARLFEVVNLAAGTKASPATVAIGAGDDVWNFGRVLETGKSQLIENLAERFGQNGRLPAGAWADDWTNRAIALPLAKAGAQELPAGFLVAGISPRLSPDDDYRSFHELVAGHISTTIANARAYEEERKRAKALAEVDRAKTAFFSNVSHEFRTPLTLMLGTLEDSLAEGGLPPPMRERLEVAHRNSMRLLKLVNTLLDFSRIEAGRIQAVYEPIDLATFTADLASVFRSAIERAGMSLIIDCPPLSRDTYVDREMWEKIVLNLISNAFKFTFEGQIEVSLKPAGESVELTVRDNGVGIAAKDLPQLFERFHRVADARGRTYEDSGIGLALVQELVKLHGGTVRVESEPGVGSAFIVSIPFGSAHLPAERVEDNNGIARSFSATERGATAFVEEALRWLPSEKSETCGQEDKETERRESQAAFRESERKFSAAFERSPLALTITSLDDGRLVEVNESFLSLTGYTCEEALGSTLDELKLWVEPERIADGLARLRAGEHIDGFEARFRTKSGEERIGILGSSLIEINSRPHELSSVSDITERERAAETLRRSEAQLRLITDTTPALISYVDTERRYRFANGAYLRWFDCVPEEIIGRRIVDVLGEAAYEAIRAEVDAALSGQEIAFDRLAPYKAGGMRYVSVNYVPDADERGEVKGFFALINDITERKRTEMNLAFLAEISQDLTRLTSIDEMMRIVGAKIGAYLDLSLCAFVEINEAVSEAVITHVWHREDTPSIVGVYRVGDFFTDEFQQASRTGEIFVVRDTEDDLRANAERFATFKIRSFVTVPLIRGGQFRFLLGACHSTAYDWRGDEIELIRELTMRIWTRLERARAEEALRESEGRFRNMADHAPVMVWVTEADATCSYLSQSWYEFTGQTPDTGSGFGWLNATHPDDRESAEQAYLAASEKREAVRLEYRLRRKDGEYRWAIDSAAPRFGSDGEFLGYIGSVMDITDRKRNEELLRIANERSELAESASNGFIYDWSLHEDAVERSQGMAAVIGYRPDEVPACSQWWIEQIHPDDLARVRAETEFVYASSDGKITTEYRVRRRDGSYITAQDRARIFRDKSGRVMRQVGTIVDITARKQAEEEIARLLAEEQVAREVAEQATRAKDEFLAVVSHELRSPLNAILGYTRILRSGPEDREDFNKVTGVIERNAKAQLQIVEDLLDSARIVTGKLRIEPSLVDLVPALEAALDTVRSAAEAKGVTLVANFRRLPERVLGDSTRLQQVVWNLLANAVKFTPAGGRVELRMDGDADHIRIVVSDTGKGVEPEFLPFVFDRFRQADTSSARRYGGVGLGLSLVKHLVELHGGTITAASKGVGRGATFTITLPRRHMELIPPAPPAVTSREVRTEGAIPRDQALSLEGVSLLVVDDQEEARVILTHALSEYGAQVTTVSSGAEALAILSRPPDGRRPDALILDIAMPDEDGYAVLKKVRALEAEQGVVVYQIPAIALTAHARAEDRLRALQAGFQMHVAKPVEPTELALVILSLIKRFDIKPGS